MEEKEIKLKISPQYNFIYELGRPTSKSVNRTLAVIVVVAIIYVTFIISSKYIPQELIAKIPNFNTYALRIFLIIEAVLFIKLVIHIIFKILEYKNITYNFYEDYLEYKDVFLNQQTKIIKYENVREVEVRRNIWERINRLGIIILYSNAEKNSKNGLVVYAIKNTKEVYDKINELVYNSNKNTQENNIITESNNSGQDIQNFKDSLKNVNK